MWGLCIVWILGMFDHQKGGHIVLHEAMRIVEVRPGRGLIFPSACITHETIPIDESETRRGFTAYSAAGLWRFIDQGCQSQAAWKSKAPDAEHQHKQEGHRRWENGVSKFMTLAELEEHWRRQADSAPPPRSGAIVHNSNH